MAFSVEGKIALITGSASGIGFEYANELISHGLKGVTIVDFDSTKGAEAAQRLNSQHGKQVAIFCRADVTKDSELKAAFDATMDTWKTIDIVINNAGVMKDGSWKMQVAINCVERELGKLPFRIIQFRAPPCSQLKNIFGQVSKSHIKMNNCDDDISVCKLANNEDAVVAGSLLALEYMGKNHGGKGGIVVNIASILGLQELSGCPIYVGTKHFVLGMTRSFGQPYFFNKTGVKFLTMCPGVTDTPLITDASGFALNNYEGLGKLLAEQLASLPQQVPKSVAKGMYHLICHGENGSVWVCEGGEPIYEVDIPDRRTLRKHLTK